MSELQRYQRTLLLKECRFETARSGGKGGQHVNKTETKVILKYDLLASGAFNAKQKELIAKRLENRISDGVLMLSCESTRSQHRNKKEVVERFFDLLESALKIRKRRIPTKISKTQKKKRLKDKKIRSEKKELRKKIRKEDYR